jgi:hypothetical protein
LLTPAVETLSSLVSQQQDLLQEVNASHFILCNRFSIVGTSWARHSWGTPSNAAAPGIFVFFFVVMISFVWAFLPFKFAMTVYPAFAEMRAASLLCKEQLLCDCSDCTLHADAENASAETCLQRMMTHVAAAAITAGRSSEVYGIVMPVRVLHIYVQLHYVAVLSFRLQINIVFDVAIIALNLNWLNALRTYRVSESVPNA